MLQRPAQFYIFATSLLTASIVLAQPPAEPAVDRTGQDASAKQQISSHIATAVRATLPAFVTPAKKSPEQPATPAPITANNDPVVLEKLTIFGVRAYNFSEQELATKFGLSELLLKRYPGASIKGQDPSLTGIIYNYAALMLADDNRLENMANLTRTADILKTAGQMKLSKELREEISRTFIRRTNWQTESMDRSVNNNRR